MTLEAHLEEEIVGDAVIAGVFLDATGDPRPPEEWYFAASSLGLGDNLPVPDRPYIVWNELADNEHAEVRETSDSRTRFLQWYVYDHPGDYTRIDQILLLLKRRIKAIGDFTTPDGFVCMQSEWNGTSGQIPSDGYDSCTKFGSSQHTVNR